MGNFIKKNGVVMSVFMFALASILLGVTLVTSPWPRINATINPYHAQLPKYCRVWNYRTGDDHRNAHFYRTNAKVSVWTDGINVYFSGVSDDESYQLILNKTTNNWENVDWGELYPEYGSAVWTDGTNVYYSYSGDKQLQLDKTTGKWKEKDWGELYPDNGDYVWTDGTNVYYSENKQLQLDKTTGKWKEKDWGELYPDNGDYVWTDEINVYYSSNYPVKKQLQLDKDTGVWKEKDWGELYPGYGSYVWTDDDNIYYSYSYDWGNKQTQYKLNTTTMQWEQVTWRAPFYSWCGSYVWQDDEHVHCSWYSYEAYITFDCTLQRHEWDDGVVTTAATCTNTGEIHFTCTLCNETYDLVIPALEHTWDAGVHTPADCTTVGNTKYTCTVCGTTKTVVSDETLGEHTFNDWHNVIEPTTEHVGRAERECIICGGVDSKELPQLETTTESEKEFPIVPVVAGSAAGVVALAAITILIICLSHRRH